MIALQTIGIIIIAILVVIATTLFIIGMAIMGKQADELSASWTA